MDDESLNAATAGLNQAEGERLPYHAPKFLSLGPIQSLVQSGPNKALHDGAFDNDGNAFS